MILYCVTKGRKREYVLSNCILDVSAARPKATGIEPLGEPVGAPAGHVYIVSDPVKWGTTYVIAQNVSEALSLYQKLRPGTEPSISFLAKSTVVV